MVGVRPEVGTDIRSHGVVTLWVGRKPPRVPDITGMSLTAARQNLEAAGYEVVVVGEGTTVLKSIPQAGARLVPGEKVTIRVWTPPTSVPTIVVPPISPAPIPSPPCIPGINC